MAKVVYLFVDSYIDFTIRYGFFYLPNLILMILPIGLYEEDLMSLGISPLQTPVEEKDLESVSKSFIAFIPNKSTDTDENLSDEALSIIEKLPDFSFMLSKSIIFPSLSSNTWYRKIWSVSLINLDIY